MKNNLSMEMQKLVGANTLRGIAYGVLAGALVLTAGCGKKEEEQTNLTLAIWDEAQLSVVQENVDAFNKEHEGKINVSVQQIPWDSYWTKLDASLETNEAPDVFWMNVYLTKYADHELLHSLDEYIEKDKLDLSVYASGRIKAFNYGDKQYALPKGLDTVVCALNKDIFQKYDVELPKEGWNWDDMRATADQLKSAIHEKGGSEYPIVMELDGQPSWINFLYQNGGYYLSEDGKTTGVALPESQDAIQQVVDLMDNGQMAPYEVLSESKGTDLFVSGQAGIVFVGSWKASVLEDSKLAQDGNVQLIQMPAMAKNNYCTMGGLGYVMSEKCKNKEAAWEFIRYISGEEAETHEAEKGIDIPAYLSAQDAYVKNFKNLDAQVFMEASKTGFPYPSNGNFDWTSFVDDSMQVAFAKKQSVKDALEEGAKKAQEVLDELYK